MPAIAAFSWRAKMSAWLALLKRRSRARNRPGATSQSEHTGASAKAEDGNSSTSPVQPKPTSVAPTIGASAPVTRITFDSLPPEVVHRIFGYVSAMLRYTHGHTFSYRQVFLIVVLQIQRAQLVRACQRQLLDLLLVSRIWYYQAIEHLYAHPFLCKAKQLRVLVDRVRARPYLAKCVKKVVLHHYDSQWESFNRADPQKMLQFLKEPKKSRRKAEPHADLRDLVALCPLAEVFVRLHSRKLLKSAVSSPLFDNQCTDKVTDLTSLSCIGMLGPISDIVPDNSTFPKLESLYVTLITIPTSFTLPSSAKLVSLYLTACYGPIRIPPPSALPSLHTIGLYFSSGEGPSSDISATLLPHTEGLRELHMIGEREHQALLALPLARFTSLRVLAVGFPGEEHFLAKGPMLPDGPIPPSLSWLICMTRLTDRSQEQQDMIARTLDRQQMGDTGLEGIQAIAWMTCIRGAEMVAFCERRDIRLTTDTLVPDNCEPDQRDKGNKLDGLLLKALVAVYMNSPSPLDIARQPWRALSDK